MSSRSRKFHRPDPSMDNFQEALQKTMLDHSAQLIARLENRLTHFETRLESCQYEPPLPSPRISQHPEPFYEPNSRKTPYHSPIQNPQVERSGYVERTPADLGLEPHLFHGYPPRYLEWERSMDQYFKDEIMTEERRFKFAKDKLAYQASVDWKEIERLAKFDGERPITTWRIMRSKLREKYLPSSHDHRSYETPRSPCLRATSPQTYPSPDHPGRPSPYQSSQNLTAPLRQPNSTRTSTPRYLPSVSPTPFRQPDSTRTSTPRYQSSVSPIPLRQPEPIRTSNPRYESCASPIRQPEPCRNYSPSIILSPPETLRTSPFESEPYTHSSSVLLSPPEPSPSPILLELPKPNRPEPCPSPIPLNLSEPTRINVHPGIIPIFHNQSIPSTPLVYQNNIREEVQELESIEPNLIQTEIMLREEVEIYEPSPDLVDAYEEEIECEEEKQEHESNSKDHAEIEVSEPDPSKEEPDQEVEPSNDLETTDPEFAEKHKIEVGSSTIEGSLGLVFEEIRGENQVIKPSLELREPEDFVEDIIFIGPLHQEESPSPIPIRNLFPEIDAPVPQPLELSAPVTQYATIESDPFPEAFPFFQPSHGSSSYFLPFLDPSAIARTTRLHFLEISLLFATPVHVEFVTFRLKTLWHVLGAKARFTATYFKIGAKRS